MQVLHILKKAPDASTRKIIDVQALTEQVTVVELSKGAVSYDKLVSDIFAHDKVMCW